MTEGTMVDVAALSGTLDADRESGLVRVGAGTVLAELNEVESAIAIIQAMLQSGSVRDPDELRFLQGKLSDLQQKLFESQQSPEK